MGIDIGAERKRREQDAAKKKMEPMFMPGKVFTDGGVEVEVVNTPSPPGKFICSRCGQTGKPRTITKGIIIVELFVWLLGLAFCWFFLISLIPAIGYSMWRHLSRFKGCPSCEGPMIRSDSPMGVAMLQRVGGHSRSCT